MVLLNKKYVYLFCDKEGKNYRSVSSPFNKKQTKELLEKELNIKLKEFLIQYSFVGKVDFEIGE